MTEKNPYNDRHLVIQRNVLTNLFTLWSPVHHIQWKFILLGKKIQLAA